MLAGFLRQDRCNCIMIICFKLVGLSISKCQRTAKSNFASQHLQGIKTYRRRIFLMTAAHFSNFNLTYSRESVKCFLLIRRKTRCSSLIRPPDIVCRRTYILPVFLLSSFFFFLSFFFFSPPNLRGR